jgi:hypothetical protein
LPQEGERQYRALCKKDDEYLLPICSDGKIFDFIKVSPEPSSDSYVEIDSSIEVGIGDEMVYVEYDGKNAFVGTKQVENPKKTPIIRQDNIENYSIFDNSIGIEVYIDIHQIMEEIKNHYNLGIKLSDSFEIAVKEYSRIQGESWQSKNRNTCPVRTCVYRDYCDYSFCYAKAETFANENTEYALRRYHARQRVAVAAF